MTTETLDKLYLEWSQITGARTARELQMEAALRLADKAINPPDKGGISMGTWNMRLKTATAAIRLALTSSDPDRLRVTR